MYVYLLTAHQDEEISYYQPLLAIAENKDRVSLLLHRERKNWSNIKVVRQRVNCKDKFFVVLHEFEEAEGSYYDFVHLTTSEKRAKGFIKNKEARQHYARGSLVIFEQHLS